MLDWEKFIAPKALSQAPLGSEADILGQGALSQADAVLGSFHAEPTFDWPCWVKTKVQMRGDNGAVQTASNLPYVFVSREFMAEEWKVVSADRTPANGVIRLPLHGTGEFRAYVKEPGEDFTPGDPFIIPQHALAEGGDSGREVQPWLCLTVHTGSTHDSWALDQQLPNAFERAAADYPNPGNATLTKVHTEQNKALNLGNYVITRQLWADASRVYGADHPIVVASDHRDVLELIYQEQLTADGNDLMLEVDEGALTIEFDALATNGGITAQTFLEEGGQMARGESLRRTHPSVLDWWLTAMDALSIHRARVTGAWRPHVGSTRHRYASALDLTHLRTRVDNGNNGEVEVEIHLHRDDTASNPLASGTAVNTPAKVRKRDFSLRFHTYVAERKRAGELNWLGGPWALTYAQVGLQGNATFIHTDNIHVHHVHLSVGSDQPG